MEESGDESDNIVPLPSDNESKDGEEQSDDETINIKNVQKVTVSRRTHVNLKSRKKKKLNYDVWSRESKENAELPFTENVGPKNIPQNIKTPGDFFLCLFSQKNIDLIVKQTNLYISQNNISSEKNVTSEEIKQFLGINMLMGLKKLPSYIDYWSTNSQIHYQYISSIMPLKRFQFLLSKIHLNDNSTEPKKGQPNFDKTYKIKPYLDNLSESYAYYYDPTQHQSIDESMIKFLGRSSMKQYMPMKPIKRGYKFWVRADENGYVCQFQMYTGKIGKKSEKCLGERVVKDLSRTLVNKNYHLYFDNYFSSINLMKSLLDDNLFACATVKKDRSGLPTTQMNDKDMKAGDSEFRTSNEGICWVKWMDKKPVQFLSNFHDPSVLSSVSRRQKDGSILTVACPELVKDYNNHMGYVDKADMMKSFYERGRKSRKWWHRIFWHFMDITVVNSFILYRLCSPNSNLTLKEYRLLVVDQLVGVPKRSKRGRPTSSSIDEISLKSKKFKPTEALRTSQSPHFPGAYTTFRRCAHCSTSSNEKRTRFYCKTCNVPLCIAAENNCFEDFHKK